MKYLVTVVALLVAFGVSASLAAAGRSIFQGQTSFQGLSGVFDAGPLFFLQETFPERASAIRSPGRKT